MEQSSVEQILMIMFGGSIDVTKVATLIVILFNIVLSLYQWQAKKKLIYADKELTTADKKLDAQRAELDEVKKSLSAMASMITTAYLSSNTIDASAKQRIASLAETMQKIANVDLSSASQKLIEIVAQLNPDINEMKEDILAETKVAEELIDTANDATSDLIDKLEV